MASGFIELRNGDSWDARWSRYDSVLEAIMRELAENGKEGELKGWILSLLPNEERGDIECGWCFIKGPEGNESVSRILDTRLMHEEYRQIFWEGVKRASEKNSDLEDGIGYLLNQLYTMYLDSLNDEYVQPEPSNTENGAKEKSKIGPGWK